MHFSLARCLDRYDLKTSFTKFYDDGFQKAYTIYVFFYLEPEEYKKDKLW